MNYLRYHIAITPGWNKICLKYHIQGYVSLMVVAACCTTIKMWFSIILFPNITQKLLQFFAYVRTAMLLWYHYNDVIMDVMASRITSLTIAFSNFNSGTDQRKHQSSTSLTFVRRSHWWPVNSQHKRPVIWKMFPFDDVIMIMVLNGITVNRDFYQIWIAL